MTLDTFKRKLRNLEGMFARLDGGKLTGRNSESSDAWRARCFKELRDALAADARTADAPLCAALDADEKLAARWNRMERRSAGL